ncbi:MAG: glucose/arabinose dehydrogenase [Bacteriovoracaceae bacterium]|jgi:glucose/arabinose dehydrogenase
MYKLIIVLFFVFFQLNAKTLTTGKSEGQSFIVEQLATGQDIIWGLDFLSPQDILFTEKSGKLKKLDLKTKKITSITGAPKVSIRGQGGFLDIRKDPSSDWIYFTYVQRKNGFSGTNLGRGKIVKDKLTSFETLLSTDTNSKTGRHFGSRISFDGDYVFFTMGDRGIRESAQELSNHAGSVMRLHKDGRVPKDNPFVKNKKAKSEIWSYGHRNPQGLVFDKERGVLFEMEHGPRGGDEINIIKKGGNYGWPLASYGREYMLPMDVGEKLVKGTIQPMKFYVPSIAPSGLEVYSGKIFKKWKGDLFSGALKDRHLNRVSLSNLKAIKEERLIEDLKYRIRSVREGPDGLLYLSTDNGKILRILPK